uniref:uncharacterized protein isoform X2 n=1 Tax=Myxine glutinosa TaxID=7769 RepID=UPI00358FF3E0
MCEWTHCLGNKGSCFRIERSSRCPPNQYFHDDRICCELCPIGTYMLEPCQVPGSRSFCLPCKNGTYMDEQNHMTMCKQCSVCDPETEVKERECDVDNNRQCVCREGLHGNENKCELKIRVESQIGFPSLEFPSLLIWLPVIFGLFFFTLFILLCMARRLCPQVRAWFNVSKILRCFNQNSTQPTINGDHESSDASEHFLGYQNDGNFTVDLEGKKVRNTRLEPTIFRYLNEGTVSPESNCASQNNFISETHSTKEVRSLPLNMKPPPRSRRHTFNLGFRSSEEGRENQIRSESRLFTGINEGTARRASYSASQKDFTSEDLIKANIGLRVGIRTLELITETLPRRRHHSCSNDCMPHEHRGAQRLVNTSEEMNTFERKIWTNPNSGRNHCTSTNHDHPEPEDSDKNRNPKLSS